LNREFTEILSPPDAQKLQPEGEFIFSKQDILLSAFALTVYIQFLLIILFSMINSRTMGSTSTNRGNGHIEINSVKD
jgi:hypothetical protein